MWTALLRKARADIAGQPLQTVLIFLAVAAATATFTLATVTATSVGNAYVNRFAEANGAHVWFFSPPDISDPSYLTPIGDMETVTATAGPFPTVYGTAALLTDSRVVDLDVYGMPAERPSVGRPILTEGRWLDPGVEREVVLDNGLARELGIGVDQHVDILTSEGIESFQVVGLAVTSERVSYPWESDAFAMVLPEELRRIQPDSSTWTWRLGTRIQEPEAAERFGQEAIATYPIGERAPDWETWL